MFSGSSSVEPMHPVRLNWLSELSPTVPGQCHFYPLAVSRCCCC